MKTNKYIYSIIVSALLLVACSEEFLERVPTTKIAASEAVSSVENMLLVVNGMHRMVYARNPRDGNPRANGEHYAKAWLSALGDDFVRTTNGSSWHLSSARWITHTSKTDTYTDWMWGSCYYLIKQANTLINAIEEQGLEQTENVSLVLSQAKTYRAWSYFRLIRLFAKSTGATKSDVEGVPLLLGGEGEIVPRNTTGEVYTQIVKDLEEALESAKKVESVPNITYFTEASIEGLLARVALTQERWEAAAKHAKNARKDKSPMSITDYLNSGFGNASVDGVMWGSLISDPGQSDAFGTIMYYIAPNHNGSHPKGCPKAISEKLFNQMSNDDMRKQLYLDYAPSADGRTGRDKTIDALLGTTTAYFQRPYMQTKFRHLTGNVNTPTDLIHMRVAEMYLIEAEAEAQLGNDATSRDILTQLISTRYSGGSYNISTLSGDALKEEVKLQRRIELWAEGFRFFDLMRYDEPLDRNGTGATTGVYQDAFTQKKASENDNWIFQIPQREINANSAMTENPKPDLKAGKL